MTASDTFYPKLHSKHQQYIRKQGEGWHGSKGRMVLTSGATIRGAFCTIYKLALLSCMRSEVLKSLSHAAVAQGRISVHSRCSV